jgi:hypothetical protein
MGTGTFTGASTGDLIVTAGTLVLDTLEVNTINDATEVDFQIGGTSQIKLTDGALTPTTDDDIDLGSATNRFKDLYLTGGTLYLGDTAVSSNTVVTTTSTPTDGQVLKFNSSSSAYDWVTVASSDAENRIGTGNSKVQVDSDTITSTIAAVDRMTLDSTGLALTANGGFYKTAQEISSSITVSAGQAALAIGTITVNSGVILTLQGTLGIT